MRLVFDPKALEHLRFWTETDRRKALKILDLIEATLKSPFEGIGKPEPLRENLSGFWSRRIDDTHRIVYEASAGDLVIIACRYHYE